MSARIGVLLLASGASRRFGSDKRMARLPSGLTLLEHMVNLIEQSGLGYRVTVRRCDSLRPKGALPLDHAAEGMGCSIAEAVSRVRNDFDALMILPVDLPLLKIHTLTELAQEVACDTLRRPVFQGQLGHPVVFGADYFDELVALKGDSGAQSVLQVHRRALQLVNVDDCGICCDIDTPQALQQLTELGAFSGLE